MICPICIIYLKCCHIRGGGAVWNIKSSTWLCVLSSWKSVSREIAHPRPPCTLRVLAWASPVPPPPPEKERRGRLRRPTRPQHRRRCLRLNCAHGSRRRSRRRARCPRRWREGCPCRCRLCRRRRCAHESRRRARRLWRRLVRRRRGVG